MELLIPGPPSQARRLGLPSTPSPLTTTSISSQHPSTSPSPAVGRAGGPSFGTPAPLSLHTRGKGMKRAHRESARRVIGLGSCSSSFPGLNFQDTRWAGCAFFIHHVSCNRSDTYASLCGGVGRLLVPPGWAPGPIPRWEHSHPTHLPAEDLRGSMSGTVAKALTQTSELDSLGSKC